MQKTYVITGCSARNNLAYKIAEQIVKLDPNAKIIAISNPKHFRRDITIELGGIIKYFYFADFTEEYDSALKMIAIKNPVMHALINCAGLNGNSWFENMQEKEWDNIMSVNVKAMYKTSQAFLPNLTRATGTILNIVSNAARIPMRCSTAYNASKSAAQMLTYQLARELTQKQNITVFSISPNKIAGTEMSKQVDDKTPDLRGWTKDQSDEYQKAGLITGVETDPDVLAEFIAFLLSTKERHFHLSGCDIHYGA